MRVLFVTNSLAMGGAEMNLVRLTGPLTRRGHHVTVASAGGGLEAPLARAGGTSVSLEMNLASVESVRRDVQTLRRLIGGRRPPDIIHVFSASPAILLVLARRLGRPGGGPWPVTFGTIMGLGNVPGEQKIVTYARAWATTLGVDMLLTISPAIEHMVRRLPIRRRRVCRAPVVGIEVNRQSLSETRRETLRAELLGDAGTKLVLTAGNLEPRKSHELFVSAAAEVLLSHPGARFVVVGEGSLREDLTAQIDGCGLSESVSLIGERTDLDDLLGCADVYVRPGIMEGFIGITVLQAQAARVPVVAFDTQDVRMAISHEITGWLVDAGDVAGLANTISRLLHPSPDDWTVVAAAHRQIMEQFDIESIVESLEDLYRRGGELRSGLNGARP